MDLKECYSVVGADYEDVVHRFRSEERVDRFLKMFLEDKSFDLLCAAMDIGDYAGAFRQVHTMKGVCMNLSLTDLQKSCDALAENLRQGNSDDNTQLCFEKTKENYLKTAAIIKNHLD